MPGALSIEINDVNGDGREDVVALYAQANEIVVVYYNQGDLKFEKDVWLTFPPIYGSSSFKLVDINGDGHIDIIVTSGDNLDYSQVFKPYHGVRIFINDGNENFEESYFYHINGASKIVTADFDRDGDEDLVVLSTYPDLFSRPYEKLLFFENRSTRKTLKFEASYIEETASANWLLMNAMDMDGDKDIVVASNNSIQGLLPPALMATWREAPLSYQVFYNQSR